MNVQYITLPYMHNFFFLLKFEVIGITNHQLEVDNVIGTRENGHQEVEEAGWSMSFSLCSFSREAIHNYLLFFLAKI